MLLEDLKPRPNGQSGSMDKGGISLESLKIVWPKDNIESSDFQLEN